MADKLTHISPEGDPLMVDVSQKAVSKRQAVAQGRLRITKQMMQAIEAGTVKKGDVLKIAQLAGIMAVKRTPDLIPLCHPLLITGATVTAEMIASPPTLCFTATVTTSGQTGVEMEALTAASTACLTAYDMLKAMDKAMVVEEIKLL